MSVASHMEVTPSLSAPTHSSMLFVLLGYVVLRHTPVLMKSSRKTLMTGSGIIHLNTHRIVSSWRIQCLQVGGIAGHPIETESLDGFIDWNNERSTISTEHIHYIQQICSLYPPHTTINYCKYTTSETQLYKAKSATPPDITFTTPYHPAKSATSHHKLSDTQPFTIHATVHLIRNSCESMI